MNEFDKAAAQVAGTDKDPIEAAAAQVVQDDRTALRSSLYNSLLENPDMAARAVQLGRKAGLPTDVVQRNMPEVQRNVQLDEFDRVLQNSPTVAKWLTEQSNAAIAHDDAENLTALDSALGFFKNTGRAAVSGLQRASAGVVGVAQAPFDLAAPLIDPLVGTVLPGNPLRATAEGLSRFRQGIERTAEGNMPKGEGNIESGFFSGIASLSTNLAALPLAFFPGGQGAALTAMTAPVAGGEFGKARDKGLGPLAAVTYGASQGAIEFATERLPLARLIGDVKVGTPFFQTLARQALLEVPGEQVATVLQDLNEWAVLNPDKPFSSYLEERPSAAAQTLVATLVGVGGQVTVAKGIEGMVGRLTEQAEQASQAERNVQAFSELDKLAAASKVRGRDVASFEAFVAQATEDAPLQDVYIDPNVLNQSGVLEALAEVSPSVRDQFTAAIQTGADIRIPVAEYTARIAGTELNQGLLDHLKVEPGGFSRAEAQEYMQNQSAALEEEVQRVVAQQEQADQFRASIDEVKGQVKTQLDQVGRFTSTVNDSYATLMGNFFGVMGAKLGMSPQELYARYTPRFQAEAVTGGQVLDQGAIESQGFKAWFGDWQDPKAFSSRAKGPVSQAVGDGNKPLVLYHATMRDFDSFKVGQPTINSTTFGDMDTERYAIFTTPDVEFAETYLTNKDGANVMPVFMSVKSPIDMRGGVGGDVIADIVENSDGKITRRDFYDIKPTETWQLFDGDFGKNFVDAAIAAGYDGAIIKEYSPTTDREHDVWVAFDPTQVKSATGNRGTFDPTDANILNQSDVDERDLVALHNIDAENLLAAAELGGLPVPSIGVTKANAAYTDFGEISLMGAPDLADPQNDNTVFAGDGYTIRFPSEAFVLAPKAEIKTLIEELKQITQGLRTRNEVDPAYYIEYEPNGNKLRNALADNLGVLAEFVKQQGIEPAVVYKDVATENADVIVGLEAFVAQAGDRQELARNPEFQAAVLEQMIVRNMDKGLTREDAANLAGPLGSDKNFKIAQNRAFVLNAIKEAQGKGNEVDYYRSRDSLRAQVTEIGQDQFDGYVESFVSRAFPDKFIENKKGKPVPLTLENVVEQMIGTQRGKEKGLTFGAGQAKAAVIKEFKSLAELKGKRDRVVSPDEYKAQAEQASNLMDAYREKVIAFYRFEDDFMTGFDSSMKALAKLAKGKITAGNARAALVANDFRDVPESVVENMMAAAQALKDAPVKYFESKPQRAVGLGEFKGAVIPSDAPQAVRDVLAQNNITVREYDPRDVQSRQQAVAELAKQLDEETGGKVLFQKRNDSARGSFNPATNTITMLKNADLSTFLHESGHFFLEVQFDIAARLQQEATLFGVETNKPGEQAILRDTNAVLQWFGLRDLAEWNSLDFEEKRSYHERFARGFEAYLFEGQAPSIEMQKVFQTFRSWLTNVYRNIVEQAKRMLGRNASDQDAVAKALDVELSPEVRAVFDRMLATEEQIQLAEQGRSMIPLFNAPDQAGMTTDEFAAYQALGKEATDDAIEDVQARTLRDLQWSRNARGREIKRLQKQAAEARREVQMEVRREVMSQPLYRAWTFLTGKIGQGDKIAPMQARKSDPNVLDESQDSLFTAIAKLGGLNKEEVLGTWGSDPADKPSSGVFGKPVWRKEGGRSIDDMAQVLGEAGYLSLDENGKVDLTEFEGRFDSEMRGSPQFSANYVPEMDFARAGDQVVNPSALAAGRIDLDALGDLDLPNEIVERIQSLKMTAKTGLHPDMVAEMFGFTSGDELVRALAMANTPNTEVEGLTDARMLERYGELATPEAIERAADIAIHNEARARFVATEANALAKAVGQPKILAKAARDFASAMIARLKVRDIRPGQYANAEARAAKAAAKASQAGDLVKAAAEKRNQLVNTYAARAAYNAQDEIERGVRFLKKFESDGTRKSLDVEYLDQIDALLERFDLRSGQSLRAIDKRTALAEWIASQREQGMEPDIPPALENEAFRKSYKDMTVEEFRGLVDTIKQIDHLGRLKNRLLTAADNRAFNEVRDLLVESINENAGERMADTRTPITKLGRAITQVKRFWSAHIKAATWARVMDGGKDGGPVWEYFIRAANERGNMETQMRADATEALTKILSPVLKQGKMGGKGQFFSSIGRSLNREARMAIALNTGNEGNLQRLLGGEGWTVEQLLPVLRSLTQEEWTAVQAIWDHFETYRPQIAAKERRVYGKEPNWVEPGSPITQEFGIKGGYYPIKYDPLASQQAEQYDDAEAAKRQLQGAFTSATTRRSFTKSRAEEVSGRPLLYSLAGVYSGVNDVIHDLSWHEWLIDTNRLLRSKAIDTAIRTKYGPEVKQQFKQWAADIAEGDKGAQNAGEAFLSRLRQGVSASGLGFNLMSAAIQITGFNQSIVRVGPRWIGRGISQYIASPIGAARDVVAKSPFMADRARTQFRELNELRNQVEGGNGVLSTIQQNSYWLMMRVQKMVDVPTWIGAYEKAISEGNDEDRAIALADQAVIDSQGSGLTKDLSGIERGSQVQKLFTVYYAYMNTAFNLGVAQTMTAKSKAKLAVDYLMIFTVPAVLGGMLKDALTPGGDDEEDPEELARKLAAEQLSYLMGTMFGVREFSNASKIITGAEGGFRDYDGPAGLRAITESYGFITQASQGEFDDAFRKSAINLVGSLFGLPAAQINRTITGTQAYVEGETDNPAAVLFGYQK